MQKAVLKRAYLLLARDRWKHPRMGTDRQHKFLVREAKNLRYTSVQQFLVAWPAYRDHKLHTLEDGSLTKVEAHWFICHLRQVKRRLVEQMIPKD